VPEERVRGGVPHLHEVASVVVGVLDGEAVRVSDGIHLADVRPARNVGRGGLIGGVDESVRLRRAAEGIVREDSAVGREDS
jgi:hypothetical protein